jgi:trk system potassium uptake protein TrkH
MKSTLRQFWGSLRPSQLFVGSFLLLISIGTCGLLWIPGLYVGPGLDFVDALFTATSAVCVTGLIVVDTATYFTPLGQAWILILIQLGGLGIITLGSLIIMALSQRLPLRSHALTTGVELLGSKISARQLVSRIIISTFLFELAGFLLLWFRWGMHTSWSEAAWPSAFHAISAFCNAGFSTYTDSLMRYSTDPFTLTVVMVLIVLGGIGFVVMSDIRQWWSDRKTRGVAHLSLHTRIVLLATGVLIFGGCILFCGFEWNGLLAPYNTIDKTLNGLFMSITARTAGFNTVDYAHASASSNFLTILLMSIGGSPGSTAGGLKTTTMAVVGIVAFCRLRGIRAASFFGRSIPNDTVQQATGFFALGFGLITAGIFAYVILEIPSVTAGIDEFSFLTYMFEATSAFNTVGLSMGVTASLTALGKIVTVVMMFVGRVGPLMLVAAVALRSERPAGRVRYASEDVLIG